MKWSFSRLRPPHIALLSTAYWIGLIAVKIGPPFVTAWRLTHLPPGHASITAGFTNLLFHLSMTRDGAVVRAGSVTLGALIGWVVGPPLLLALTWRWAREAEVPDDGEAAPEAAAGADASVPPLPAPSPQWNGTPGDPSELKQEKKRRPRH